MLAYGLGKKKKKENPITLDLRTSAHSNETFLLPCSGLLITYVALNLMDGHGQPALLYIVPFTLGILFVLSRFSLHYVRDEPS